MLLNLNGNSLQHLLTKYPNLLVKRVFAAGHKFRPIDGLRKSVEYMDFVQFITILYIFI